MKSGIRARTGFILRDAVVCAAVRVREPDDVAAADLAREEALDAAGAD
jgi:hypothetical protein